MIPERNEAMCVGGIALLLTKQAVSLVKKREGSQDSWESGIHLNIMSSYGYWVIMVFPFLLKTAYIGMIFTLF